MESNREESRRALEIARRKKAEGDILGAIKFAKKSQSLFSTPEADDFLAVLADLSSSNGTAYTSGTSTPRSSNADGTTEGSARIGGGARERKKAETQHRQGRQNVEYTKEQVIIVERVRKCKHHQYYEILELKTEATDAEIKKSYRRLALQLHPDKNGAPGADEAFKMVSRAFQVLSDPDKRAAFDRHGEDPDSRTAGMGGGSPFGNGFSGMRAYNGGGGMYADEVSPEDLFNMFFGGGGFGGGGFNASPFTAQFGGPGFRVHTFGGGRGPQQRRPQQQQQQENSSVLYQLLPVLILLAVTIIPALFNSSTPSAPPPSFVFDPQPPYTVQRLTPQHSIPYFLKSDDLSKLSNTKLRQLDQKAEITFVRGLRDQCQVEYDTRQQRMADAQGWWGQVKDQEKWDAAKTMRLESCERLKGMGYRPEIY